MTDQQPSTTAFAAVVEQMANATRQHAENHRAADRQAILTAVALQEDKQSNSQQQPRQT